MSDPQPFDFRPTASLKNSQLRHAHNGLNRLGFLADAQGIVNYFEEVPVCVFGQASIFAYTP